MEDFLSQFGGAQLLSNAKSSALRTMESGFAKLVEAKLHTKTKGGIETYSVKVEFDALAPKQDGIDDYIRTSRANELAKAINKYKYLFIYQDNIEANNAFNACGNPFKAIQETVEVDGVTVTRNIEITSLKEDLPRLRELHGEQLDYVYVNDVPMAVEVVDAKGYCEKLTSAINMLKDSTYRLKITAGRNNFDQISTITKANL